MKKFSKEILHAKTGIEALELCRKNPDINFNGYKMSEMCAYKATRKICEFKKEVIIIDQTAFILAGYPEKAIEAGCNDYITKPIKKEVLFGKIKKYFGK